MIGGMQNQNWGDWYYGYDGSYFQYTDTGTDGGAYLRIQDVNNEAYKFYWTIDQFEEKMNE